MVLKKIYEKWLALVLQLTTPLWMQMLLALMDEAYTGSTIGDEGPDFESEDSNTMAVADPLFLELLKDENDGLAVCPFHSSFRPL